NLVLNARDAMPQGGTVTLSTELVDAPAQMGAENAARPPRALRLRVIDQGSGIESDLAERIFEPFFTTKAQTRRAGLGLATVRNLASEHGGLIEVESRPGEGGTFSVYFPVRT